MIKQKHGTRQIVLIFTFLTVLSIFACNKSTTQTDVPSTETGVPPTQVDDSIPSPEEVGRAYGIVLASSVKLDELDIDMKAFTKAFEEVFKQDKVDNALLSEASQTVRIATSLAFERKVEKVKLEGEEFLAKNGERSEVITTESGLQYEVIKEGDGELIDSTNEITLHYIGSFLDGTEFENSKAFGEPITLKAENVIPGWREGLQFMRSGGVYKLYIPSDLAYGVNGARDSSTGQYLIWPYSVLIFDVEIISVN